MISGYLPHFTIDTQLLRLSLQMLQMVFHLQFNKENDVLLIVKRCFPNNKTVYFTITDYSSKTQPSNDLGKWRIRSKGKLIINLPANNQRVLLLCYGQIVISVQLFYDLFNPLVTLYHKVETHIHQFHIIFCLNFQIVPIAQFL